MGFTEDHSGVFEVPALYKGDHTLSITIQPTGHHREGGKPCFAYTLAGFIDTDDHGGTRRPVAITGTDLAGWSEAEEMAHTLAVFMSDYAERQESASRAATRAGNMQAIGIDGWARVDAEGDPFPTFTTEQWRLLIQEGERLGVWELEAADTV